MKNRLIVNYIKALVLLSPLPFGCVGEIFSPLFYILVLILSLLAINQEEQRSLVLYERKIRFVFYAFSVFLVFQVLPLPLFLLKIISPATVRNLSMVRDQVPAFHTISMVPFETVMYGTKFLVLALFFMVMTRIKFQRGEMIAIVKTIILSSVLQTTFGFIKLLNGNQHFFLFFHQIKGGDRLSKYLTGTLGNPNHFAFYLEMILPLGLALFFLRLHFFEFGKSFKEKFISKLLDDRKILYYLVVPILLGAGVILTGSRAGILTMVLTFLIFAQYSFYLKQSRTIRKKLKYILVAITLLALFWGAQHTVEKFLRTDYDNAGRFIRWPATLSMAMDYPLFGSGFGTYRYSFFLYDKDEGGKWSTHAHNDYLEVLAEGGVLGSLLFFSLLGLIIFSILKMWQARKHPEIKMIGLGIISSLFAGIFHSLFDFSLRIPANMFLLVLILVLGIKMTTYKRDFPE